MISRTYEGIVTAISSIAHSGGDSFGTDTLFRREKFAQPEGPPEEVPVVSGNAMRGLLRDLGMTHMCRQLGYGDGKGLTLPAFHFLFSGGSLTSTGNAAIDIERGRKLREAIPLVSIFGGAVGNNIMPGKLKCNKLVPICAETVHLMPEKYRPGSPLSVWEYLQKEMYTRKDDAKSERYKPMIEPAHVALLEAAEAAARESLDPVAGETGRKQQMMYHVETLCAGTKFWWRLVLDDVTDIEFDAFVTTLVEFAKAPYIGGKSGTGLGEVSIRFDKWLEIDSRLSPEGKEIALPAGAVYAKHLRGRSEEIRSLLETIQ